MNINTGELFENREDALKKSMVDGMSELEAANSIMPLDKDQFNELQGMNRAERRQWARDNKKKGKS